ncbi:hypothetical protein P3T37_005123 [Kitasatospora sp. MAA4]|uniref:hypothetical protein n=1 Tax=Kitasatospora sp. MAA4 TaxID=3035093 RepID=UPI002473A500|nr:hypothetical protein [Kitasatospora sp. MAA4]MDH6135706.1 hypothetical protein [Kitasatospora sp. MAA4]
MSVIRRQVAASVAELNAAFAAAGLPLDPPLDAGWQVTEAGAVLVLLRPLHLAEVEQLAMVAWAAVDRG